MALMNPSLGELDGGDAEYEAAVASGDLQKLFSVLEREQGLPAGYLRKTAQIESRMNPNAKNPRSSAGGLFQQLDSNARQYGVQDKFDPVQSALGAAMFAGDNADVLMRTLGREPTAGELYLAHQQGPGGATKLLANPNAPASSIVGDAAARLNGGAGKTAGQLAKTWTSKLDGAADMPATDAIPVNMETGEKGFAIPGAGLMNRTAEAYQPAKQDNLLRNAVMALGQSIASGKRGDYTGGFSTSLNALQASDEKRDDRRYDMWRDQRNFNQTLSESQRAQSNADRGFGLQERQVNMTAEERKADNARADASLQLQKDAAGKDKIITRPDGSVVAIPDTGAPVEKLPAIKSLNEVEKRKREAEEYGLTGEARANYILNGKYDPQTAGANPYANPGGGKTTGEQDKSSGFADRMFQNESVIRKNETLGTGRFERGAASIPGIGSMITSDAYKSQDTAKRNWIAAQLRKESGAAIGQDEYAQADQQYFPQPGDGPDIIAQKRNLRQTATEGMARDGGPGYSPKMVFDQKGELQPYKRPGASAAPSATSSPAAGPTRAELEAEARRRGLIQ